MEKTREMAIKDQKHVILLSVEDQIKFAEMLLNPRELTPELRRAQAAHKKLIVSSRNV